MAHFSFLIYTAIMLIMNKKVLIFISFLLIYTHCKDSNSQNTSESPKDHTIILDAELGRKESITISYSPLYADNIIYSTELSQRGDCLKMKSNYLNAIVITHEREELCDNADAARKEYCGSERQIKIILKREKLKIESSSSLDSSDDHCEPFETEELKRRMEHLNTCINEFSKYDPNKAPLSQEEDIEKRKDCVIKARDS